MRAQSLFEGQFFSLKMPKRRCRVLQKDVLSVASDCTGLNAAAMALESLNLPFQEEWVSDSDVAVRSVLQRNFVPNHLPVVFFQQATRANRTLCWARVMAWKVRTEKYCSMFSSASG